MFPVPAFCPCPKGVMLPNRIDPDPLVDVTIPLGPPLLEDPPPPAKITPCAKLKAGRTKAANTQIALICRPFFDNFNFLDQREGVTRDRRKSDVQTKSQSHNRRDREQ